MADEEQRADLRRALAVREEANHRLRRFTGGAVAAAVTLSGIFAAFAAGSTHTKKVVAVSPVVKPAPTLPGLTVAPRAPLVTAQSAPSSTPAPSTPVSPPVSSSAPPVVSSGGS